MISESRTENGAAVESSYIYDAIGQLTEFTRSDGTAESYTYDPAGNMLSKTAGGIKTNYTYNAANQLVGDGTYKYTYDKTGNLVEKTGNGGQVSYTYNALNLLEKWTDGENTETYTYNAAGLLSTVNTNTSTTSLTWDILYGEGVVISSVKDGETTDYTYGLERISASTKNSRTEYVYDGRGSVIGEVTKAGLLSRAKVTTKAYTPFGEQIGEKTSGFGWNGEYFNATTGQVYLRARFYEPEMNRFGQKDILRGSIATPQTLNRYTYCGNDPVNFIDPSGMVANWLKVAAGAVAGGVVGAVVGGIAGGVAASAATKTSAPPASNPPSTSAQTQPKKQEPTPTPTPTPHPQPTPTPSPGPSPYYPPSPVPSKGDIPQVEIQNSQKCCTPKESNNLTWDNVKNVLNTVGRFTKDVIYPSIEFYAGVGQGIGGSFNVLDVVGLDLEFSANYFDVRLDDGQWSWGQRLHAEASIDIVTFEAGVADISVTDNNGVEQNNLSSKGGFAEIKLPDEISASAYLLFLGGSFSIKINYEDLAENIEAFSNNER